MTDASGTRSILLAEDTPEDRELLDLACRSAGLAVDWQVAGSCQELTDALRDIAAGHRPEPDLVIMDLRLPDGTATDLLPTIRHHLRQVPVIVFSTSSAIVDRQRVSDDPAVRYLVKPHAFRGYAEILEHIREAEPHTRHL